MDNSKIANNKNIILYTFANIDSTNDFLLRQKPSPKIQVCIAKHQLQGKGQYDRKWLDTNSSTLLSIRINIKRQLNGLSIIIGIALVKVLKKLFNIDNLAIKWPNDIYYNDKKLAGILIENKINANINDCVIGIGLNIVISDNMLINNNYTDLQSILSNYNINKNHLSNEIITKVLVNISNFERFGLDFFRNSWQKLDYLFDKTICLIDNNSYLAKGIDDNGALLLIKDNKTKILYNSNEIISIQ